MAERRGTMKLPDGKVVEGVEVQILESTEKWSEFTLEDGSILRAKVNMMSYLRPDGQYDPDGNPAYLGKAQITTAIVSVPEQLRQKK
jgi:hypothetical protein